MDNRKENCYFWIDETVPEDERVFSIYCEGCRKNNPEMKCWFWEGSVKGYGPYDYVCDVCGKVIHRPGE